MGWDASGWGRGMGSWRGRGVGAQTHPVLRRGRRGAPLRARGRAARRLGRLAHAADPAARARAGRPPPGPKPALGRAHRGRRALPGRGARHARPGPARRGRTDRGGIRLHGRLRRRPRRGDRERPPRPSPGEIHLHKLETARQLAGVAERRLDVGFSHAPTTHPIGVTGFTVLRASVIVAVAAGPRPAPRPAIAPADLAGEGLLIPIGEEETPDRSPSDRPRSSMTGSAGAPGAR